MPPKDDKHLHYMAMFTTILHALDQEGILDFEEWNETVDELYRNFVEAQGKDDPAEFIEQRKDWLEKKMEKGR